jgi:hypothetical protein
VVIFNMTLLTGPQKGKHGHNVHLANSIFVPVRSSGFLRLHRCRCIANCLIAETFLYAPCMVYLPTFWWFLGQMLVNIPAPWSIWDLYGFIIESALTHDCWNMILVYCPLWEVWGLHMVTHTVSQHPVDLFTPFTLYAKALHYVRIKQPDFN